MIEWPLTRLEELIEVRHGFAFKGSEITTDKTDCVLVTPGNFSIGGGWKESKKYLQGLPPDNYAFSPGDIVVTMTDLSKETDTLGYSAKIPNDGRAYAHNQRVGKVMVKDGNPDFLYWLMRTRDYQWHCVASASGTSVMHTSPSRIAEFEFNCPPVAEQEAIAEVLSSLDDKIDLLKRQNKTLEGMAEALFRQWFIEEAQDDWEEFTVNDIAENIRSVIKPGDIDRKVRLVGLEHFDSKSLVLSRYEDTDVLGSQKYIFEQGQILFGKLRPYFHNIAIPFFDGACSTDVLVIQAKEPEWRFFLFFFLNQDWVVEVATQSAEGTRMPRTNWNFLASLPVQLPDPKLLSEFNGLIEPVVAKLSKNWTEINLLQDKRDTLLPKLMSGQVRVKMIP